MKTSLWSIKKEKWIEGPNLLHSPFQFSNLPILDEAICLIGVGNGEVYIIVDNDLTGSYNFYTNKWKKGKTPPESLIHHHSCIFYQNKEYER